MPDTEFRIDAHDLQKLINKLDNASGGRTISQSLEQSGQYLIGWIKKNRLTGPRPRYLGVVTGRLRSSISSSRVEKVAEGWRVRLGTNVKYAEGHEFGFRRVGGKKIKMRARPFMRPAIESRSNQLKVLNIFTKNINMELEKK